MKEEKGMEREWERRGIRSHTPILNQFFGLVAL